MPWAIKDSSDKLLGFPRPLKFKTKKEARKRLDKIRHQARGGLGELSLVEVGEAQETED